MSVYHYIAIVITLAASITYLNHRFFQWHATIAVMASALIISLVIVVTAKIGVFHHYDIIQAWVVEARFNDLVMNVMLGALLFAGSMTIDFSHLKQQKLEIALLTLISTAASTFVIAIALYYLASSIGISLSWIYCLLFGSLISPTDPVAVLAIFKQLNAPKALETTVAAESLLNDGVGVVLFLTTYSVAFLHTPPTFFAVTELFFREAVGGMLYGLVLGWLAFRLLKPIQDSKIEILLTLGIVFGGYSLAQALDLSAPLAMVVAGVFLANYRQHSPQGIKHRKGLNHWWELIDELLNVILFLMLGFEFLAIRFNLLVVILGLVMILVCLLARYLTVACPMALIYFWRKPLPYTMTILSWGGLRGGLAVALALSIPNGEVKDILLTLTYIIVLFSILIQGTTIKSVIRRISTR